MISCRTQRLTRRENGFTLIEVMVALAVIALILALSLPAIQAVREAARRAQCTNNLRQIGVAIQSYFSTHSCFPPGNANGWSTQVFLLPHLEQAALYNTLGVSSGTARQSRDTPTVRRPRVPKLQLLQCPSDAFSNIVLDGDLTSTSYCGNWGTGQKYKDFNGLFTPVGFSGATVTDAMVDDGLGNTGCFAEILVGSGELSRLRTIWTLPIPVPIRLPDRLDTLATNCMLLTTAVSGRNNGRGRPWDDGAIFKTGYTHLMPPRQPNCLDGNVIEQGGYSAGSQHGSGANLMFADAHVRFVSESVDLRLWRSWGTRASQDH